ncbi:MAG TPA: HIT domain-containing protein [Spirochaetota bacterium]|nr:HIT domain-containing protein [Spirochaetota bacterium]
MTLKFQNLFSLNKLSYIKGGKPKVDCILCSIVENNKDVVSLLVTEGSHTAVCVNKFPYNSGHILIFPKRHITDYRELETDERREIDELLRKSLDVLDSLYAPAGYNIGLNIGDFAGASISHLHLHVIPRYKNELGFIDIVGGSKIIVEDPAVTMARLHEAFNTAYGASKE